MASLHVLVIDDEAALRQIVAATLARAGYAVEQASGVREARAKLARGDIDVALCDIKMPDGTGIDLLRQSKASGLGTVFVMVTASASMETAVEALRGGAYDYIVKPVRNEELLNRLAQIEAMRGLSEENKLLRAAAKGKGAAPYRFTSPCMLEVERLVNKVAPTNSTVLLTGESGSGKGMLARTIHEKSLRSSGPFVPVNCGAIPEQLLESELFGHTRGSFTGADRTRKGLFVEADRGTLFLDEIGELPMPMQTKLLHVIEEKQVRAVGSEQIRRVDTRILVATNRDLPAMVERGAFREDLYFRLSMFQIVLPPLRERHADLRNFVHFLLQNGPDVGTDETFEIDPDAEAILLSYAWPGNVRELDNVINRARILTENNRITVADLPAALVGSSSILNGDGADLAGETTLRLQLRRYEIKLLQEAIVAAEGDRRAAAQKLGISLSSLYRKLGEAVS
ncbi:MAG TPA: sigma-54 dependent transcriptional regulator [Steroidobacteraceae bacterium]